MKLGAAASSVLLKRRVLPEMDMHNPDVRVKNDEAHERQDIVSKPRRGLRFHITP